MRLPAVEQQQVGPFVLTLEPALHDLLHHAKIVHGVALDRVGAVLLLGRSAVAQHDTRAHPLLTLQLRHVETDDVIQTVQASRTAPSSAARCSKLPEPRRASRPTWTSAFWSAKRRSVARSPRMGTAIHLRASALLEPCFDAIEQGHGREQQAWWAPRFVVVRHEGRDGFTQVASVHHRPDVLRLDDALVGVKHDHCGEVALDGHADGVAVPVQAAGHHVLGNHFPNGANAVADHRSMFVGVRVCGWSISSASSSRSSVACPLRILRAVSTRSRYPSASMHGPAQRPMCMAKQP